MFKERVLSKWVVILSFIALLLCFCVIGMGAFTRLTEAGLGCPDWPACYGHLFVPSNHHASNWIYINYQTAPFVWHKALIEMLHRYAAAILGVFILAVALLGGLLASYRGLRFMLIPVGLVVLLLYQVLLGMWTVTYRLLPIIVAQHLLVGVTIFALLGLLLWRARKPSPGVYFDNQLRRYRSWGLFLLFLVYVQVALGAWTSAQYAGLVCQGLLWCSPEKLLHYNFKEAFALFSFVGVNHEGGMLSNGARMTIQVVHRFGAVVVILFYIAFLVRIKMCSGAWRVLKNAIYLTSFLFLLQIALGLLNVYYRLPIGLALAHNFVAALILLSVFRINHFFYRNNTMSKIA